jgi:energy-coupling factor transport system permease protein
VWAAGLAVVAGRTTSPLLLALVFAVVASVVVTRRGNAPWAATLGVSVRFGVTIVLVRLVIQVVFGAKVGGHQLFALPRVPLPTWAAGVSIGGPVTVEAILGALYQGLQLAVILACFAAANSLASPYRLLRCLPSLLYEAGVAVTVGLAFTPEAMITVRNIRDARRLRGRPVRGIAGVRGMAVPVLEGALDRSLELAASMDARGYGRRVRRPGPAGRVGDVATVAGLILSVLGVAALVDQTGIPGPVGPVILPLGVAMLAGALVARGRRTTRTRYRPDRWGSPEWLTAASVLVPVVAVVATGAGIHPSVSPPQWPALAAAPLAAILVALAPAALTPPPLPGSPQGTGAPAGTEPGETAA